MVLQGADFLILSTYAFGKEGYAEEMRGWPSSELVEAQDRLIKRDFIRLEKGRYKLSPRGRKYITENYHLWSKGPRRDR